MQSHVQKLKKRGFTLVELLISILILSILMGAIYGFFQLSINSFVVADAHMSCNKAANKILDEMEVGPTSKLMGESIGLDRVIYIKQAAYNRLSFLTSWNEVVANGYSGGALSNIPAALSSLDISMAQYKAFQPGANPPVVLVRDAGGNVKVASTAFKYDSENRAHVVSITNTTLGALAGKQIILSYMPALQEKGVDCSIEWTKTKTMPGASSRVSPTLKRTYYEEGKRQSKIYDPTSGVNIDDFHFVYYDRTNKELTLEEGGELTEEQILTVTAVEIYLSVSKRSYQSEYRRFIQCRALGHSMLVTADNSGKPLMTLPASDKIEVLALSNIHGAKKGSEIIVEAGAWKTVITFTSEDEGVALFYYNNQKDKRVDENGKEFDNERIVRKDFGINLLNPDIVIDIDGTATKSGTPTKQQIAAKLKNNAQLQSFSNTSLLYFVDSNGDLLYTLGEPLVLKNMLPSENPEVSTRGGNDQDIFTSLKDAFNAGKGTTPQALRQVNIHIPRIMYYDSNNDKQYNAGEPIVYDLNYDATYAGSYYDTVGLENVPVTVTLKDLDGLSMFIEGN